MSGTLAAVVSATFKDFLNLASRNELDEMDGIFNVHRCVASYMCQCGRP